MSGSSILGSNRQTDRSFHSAGEQVTVSQAQAQINENFRGYINDSTRNRDPDTRRA